MSCITAAAHSVGGDVRERDEHDRRAGIKQDELIAGGCKGVAAGAVGNRCNVGAARCAVNVDCLEQVGDV